MAPGKRYNYITVNGETSYNFRGLDKGTTYYFSIEALGEAGDWGGERDGGEMKILVNYEK